MDGGIHQDTEIKEYDINRTAEIEKWEIKVIRFSNEEVIENIGEVLNRIKMECER